MSKDIEITPVTITYSYVIQKLEAPIECMSLLSLVMQSYGDLPERDRDAVATWFYKTYKNRLVGLNEDAKE
jgi:hypothetical protein